MHYTSAVQSALEELLIKGLILETQTNDSRAHYRVNPDKFGELLEILEEAKRTVEQGGLNAPKKASQAKVKSRKQIIKP